MPDKRCENGHFIDAQWDICPYCPPSRPAQDPAAAFASVRERSARENAAVAESNDQQVSSPSMEPVHRTIVAPRVQPVEAARLVVGWLVALNGKPRGESYPVRMGRNTIGRSSRSDVVVNDDQVSAHHADVVYRPDERRFIIMDHNSTNGTFVNGAEIQARKDLVSRDIVRLGRQKFIFQALCDQSFGWDDQEHEK